MQAGYRQPDPEMLERIKGLAAKKYPGRSLSDLSDAEKSALLEDFKTQKAYLYRQLTQKGAGPRQLGNVVVNNPWEGAADAFQKGLAGYQLGKLKQREALGKAAGADLSARAGALQREDANSQWERERELWERFLRGEF